MIAHAIAPRQMRGRGGVRLRHAHRAEKGPAAPHLCAAWPLNHRPRTCVIALDHGSIADYALLCDPLRTYVHGLLLKLSLRLRFAFFLQFFLCILYERDNSRSNATNFYSLTMNGPRALEPWPSRGRGVRRGVVEGYVEGYVEG